MTAPEGSTLADELLGRIRNGGVERIHDDL